MAYNRPTLPSLVARTEGDLESSLPGANARLARSNLNILARLLAGLAHGLYGFIGWMAKQIFPSTADGDELDRHARFWLTVPRKPAAPSTGTINLAGTNGTVVPSGTVWLRSDNAEFVTDEEVVISAGVGAIKVTASEAGVAGNTADGVTLSLASPIAGLESIATVAADGLTGGTDTESDADLRARVEARPKQPPHGGADFDYVTWAEEVPGVTRAWCYPKEQGAGTVTVRFVRDNDPDPIPNGDSVAKVQAYIDARAPVTAEVFVVAPVSSPVNFVFSSVTPNTADVKAAVETELADLFKREANPGATLLISRIRATISGAAGLADYDLTAPAADVATGSGYLPTIGSVTWP